ncbi:MAG: type II toxin-antitoxin system RelE/ParE family toxin [Sneathiellaceae bacterium]
MKRRRVAFRPLARADLIALYDFIADKSGPAVALGYVERLEAACLALAEFPERGTRRDGIRPGIRSIGFERRATILFQVRPEDVLIVRIAYAGRDLQRLFEGSGDN